MALGSMISNLFNRNATQRAAERDNRARSSEATNQRWWNELMWNKQNAYNTPTAQMERLEAAGLNPRLIYGQSSGGAAGNAGDVSGYSQPEIKSTYKGNLAFQDIIASHQMEAQTDNIRAQEKVNQQTAIVKSQEALNTALDYQQKSFDLGLDKDLREYNVQAAQANVQQQMNSVTKGQMENEITNKTMAATIKKADIEVRKATEELTGKQLENELKRIQIKLRKEGGTESDNFLIRAMAQEGTLAKLIDNGVSALRIAKMFGDKYSPEQILKMAHRATQRESAGQPYRRKILKD